MCDERVENGERSDGWGALAVAGGGGARDGCRGVGLTAAVRVGVMVTVVERVVGVFLRTGEAAAVPLTAGECWPVDNGLSDTLPEYLGAL